jgi:hypothetical protein
MKNKSVIVTIVVAVVVGVGGFFGGMQYQKSKTPIPGRFDNLTAAQRAQFGNRAGRSGTPGGAGGGGFISGSIISKDDKSITVKDQSGSTKIVYFSDSTTIAKSDKGSASDLISGQQVIISGKANSDGSIAADNIQIRPSS